MTALAVETLHVPTVGVIARMRESLGRWLEYRRTVTELQALSARSLSDLGYHRGEIRAVARREVYGR